MDQLKQRLRQYNDYDEIKRELEIMKVFCVFLCGMLYLLKVYQVRRVRRA